MTSAPVSLPSPATISPLEPVLPARARQTVRWRSLHGAGLGLAVTAAAQRHDGPVVVICADTPETSRLEYEMRFFAADVDRLPVLTCPDWETLPYDVFSPHQDIVSQRLATLHRLPSLRKGVLIIAASTLLHRLPPRAYLDAHSLTLDVGQTFELEDMRRRLEASGYRCVTQVMEHGEFAVRGSIFDLYPMGSALPYRIDLLDEEIDTIRTFDPDTQRSVEEVRSVRLLPARELALTEEGVTRFRQAFRAKFEGDPQRSPVYRDVSQRIPPPGVEYYLPLFFGETATLFDYLPQGALLVTTAGVADAGAAFWHTVEERYEQGRHDRERPLLPPGELFLRVDDFNLRAKDFPRVAVLGVTEAADACTVAYATKIPPPLPVMARAPQPLGTLTNFLAAFPGRVLFAAETAGRRESLLDALRGIEKHPTEYSDWHDFLKGTASVGITIAPLEQGLLLEDPVCAIITESQLFGEQVMQRRRRKGRTRDSDAVVRNLAELNPGAPVVHEEHGVGRYLGLQTLGINGVETEFLALEYAGGDKLYVPVSSLHLISRYTGAAPEQAPLHKLGSDQWAKARKKAAEKVRDVAAELLELYAKRAARPGHAFPRPDEQYRAFASAFPFEETPDQLAAIDDVINDMVSGRPMDRLVCGDVGFGKTEVALRAAFLAVISGKQVAVLVPTTLLAQQHLQNFCDRFADWPIRIESLSRMRTASQQDTVLKGVEEGTVDIVIGTHKLLQRDVKFKRLGLVVLDEEHRFGVRQKEQLKALRAEVDVLTLTATPIPRTLNMSLSGLRDLSIIATPPSRRLAIKTFVREWDKNLIREACLREISRGGQVYFLHNEVKTIDKATAQLNELVPEARTEIAHGQMHERELERVMRDFYHHRFNVLVCTTIIETGIDIPSANTIIINRADKFGLAQLHQLRGRVGRSYHQAYAYLIVPSRKLMTSDAVKRLEAIESLEDLGAGFTLATHDLEIRGAGELLGDEQSGQMQEVGFTLYTELLERAVQALKLGRIPDLDAPSNHDAEIDLRIPALLPADYAPDVHARLVLYKRIASAESEDELKDLQVELIDRFGLLPEAAKNLFRVTQLKLKARPLGIRKIEAGPAGGRVVFGPQAYVDPRTIIKLIQQESQTYKLDGQDKLRFNLNMPNAEARLAGVEKVLGSLAAAP